VQWKIQFYYSHLSYVFCILLTSISVECSTNLGNKEFLGLNQCQFLVPGGRAGNRYKPNYCSRCKFSKFLPLQNPHEIMQRNFQKYGKIYCTFRGRSPVLHIQDLNLLRQILIKDSLDHFGQRNRRPVSGESDSVNKTLSMLHGEQWKVLRNLVIAAFSPPVVSQRLEFVNASVEEFIQYWIDKTNGDGSNKMDLRV